MLSCGRYSTTGGPAPAAAAAVEAWQADPGMPGQLTSRQIDLPGKAAIAERDLKDYEAELLVIKLLRAELRLRAAEGADPMRTT